MRILLTGASGLVGAAVARAAARRGHTVLGVTHAFTSALAGVTERLTLDLTDLDALTTALLHHWPDAIINAAAVSEPAACEADPARAQTLNVALPARLAQLAHHLHVRLVHVSTEQVFGGDRAPYAADDPPAPLHLYGRQKLAGENAVHDAAPDLAVTVRAPLLNGDSPSGTRSLHERLFVAWAAGHAPRLYADEIRQVAHADNLADVLVELCERPDLTGRRHWAGTDALSRFEQGERIRARFRLTPEQAPLLAVARAEDPAASRRPADLRLDLGAWVTRLRTRPEDFTQQLSRLVVPPPARAWYLGLTL
jgi:dTDP-4-dehydrorhamnose reductase